MDRTRDLRSLCRYCSSATHVLNSSETKLGTLQTLCCSRPDLDPSLAQRLGHTKLVRWLLARREIDPMRADASGTHALHKAVSFGSFGCVEALLADRRVREQVDRPVARIEVAHVDDASGADTASAARALACDQGHGCGETALHLACTARFHTNHKRISRALLAAGADPNLHRRDGRTPVHNAAASGNVSVLKELLRSGRGQTSHQTRDLATCLPRCASLPAAAVLPRQSASRRS